jgi:hypothetical protein
MKRNPGISRRAAILALGLAVSLVGCSDTRNLATSPSPLTGDANAGNPNTTLPKPTITVQVNVPACGLVTISWDNTTGLATRWHVQVSAPDATDFTNPSYDNAQYTSQSLVLPLALGTYLVRVNAQSLDPHVNNSGFTAATQFIVVPCATSCTFSQGYFKTHYPNWPSSVISGGLTLGTVSYTVSQLEDILLGTPAGGNGLVSLAHQLIAAKVNIANGADGTAAAAAIAAADALIGGLVIPPVGGGFLASSSTSALTQTLNDYNTGVTGPGHCSSDDVNQ